ncbi:hypothetical protein [Paraburkholderia sp. CNPSo 3281]|uniref:hypothetical protein n=1 Tax=Paraburkholderia sp. CNPSo 3281 TaxID=2940933 RepID=UPI0020B638A3|nr:hypothetical protein [Paraburkholderia sp. CNPSo 3281]MCP3720996.1 hypothetical protein [Paraburkholderia sp. CNPSo 3281]
MSITIEMLGSFPGSYMPETKWLLYAENAPVPLCRKLDGSYMAEDDIWWGPLPVTLLELFPTRVRFSCSAIGVNVAYAVFGGTAPLLGTSLVQVTGSNLAPAVYAVVVMLISLNIVSFMSETYRKPLL